MKVGIVGAGPAGLTLAHALLTLPGKSVTVSVYDSSDALRPSLGGGLQLSCGAGALQRLGLDVSKIATPIRSVLSRRAADRRTLLSIDVQAAMLEAGATMVPPAASDGAFAIMRDQLQQLLASELPPSALCLGRTVAAVAPRKGGGATLSFADGSADEDVDCGHLTELAGSTLRTSPQPCFSLVLLTRAQETCTVTHASRDSATNIDTCQVDLVCGCDGIRSVVKSYVSPNEPPASYSGVKVLLAVATAGSRPLGAETAFHQWLGDGAYEGRHSTTLNNTRTCPR